MSSYPSLNNAYSFKHIIDAPIFQGFGNGLATLKELSGHKKFILGLKCFKKNEYCGFPSSNGDNFSSPVYSCKFGSSRDTYSILGLAHEDGKVVLQQTEWPHEGRYLTDKVVHHNAIFDMAWIPKKNELLTAAADSSVCLLEAEDLKIKTVFHGHTKSVKALDSNSLDTNVFASGGRDCNVIIWDIRCQPNNKANEILGAHNIQKSSTNSCNRACASQIQNSVISVLFHGQQNLVSAGASDGFIKVWDLRRTYSRGKRGPQSLHMLEYSGNSSCRGYTSMRLSPHGEKLYVSCLDGKIYAYHIINPTPQPVAEFYGHKPNTYYTKFCISPCGSYLLSGSSDDVAYIWVTKSPGIPVASLTGHLDEVTCVAWSSGNLETLVTCSDDMKHRLFKYRPVREKELTDPEMKENLECCAVPYLNDKPISISSTPSQQTLKPGQNVDVTSEFSPLGQRHTFDTYSTQRFSGLSRTHSPLSSPVLSTPEQRQGRRSNEQLTPKTSGTKTLLSWLSSSKTPKEVATTPGEKTLQTSSQKNLTNKITSKRKLADLMESSRENLEYEEDKLALSPSKHVLEECQNLLIANPLTCSNSDNNRVRNTFCKSDIASSPTSIAHIKTPVKSQLLSSPTANLPNFVVDGRSPSQRWEAPLTRQRQSDWLTSLGQKHTQTTEAKEGAKKTHTRIVARKRKVRLKYITK